MIASTHFCFNVGQVFFCCVHKVRKPSEGLHLVHVAGVRRANDLHFAEIKGAWVDRCFSATDVTGFCFDLRVGCHDVPLLFVFRSVFQLPNS